MKFKERLTVGNANKTLNMFTFTEKLNRRFTFENYTNIVNNVLNMLITFEAIFISEKKFSV